MNEKLKEWGEGVWVEDLDLRRFVHTNCHCWIQRSFVWTGCNDRPMRIHKTVDFAFVERRSLTE